MKGRRFWIENEFIDEYARNLSIKAQCVYMCLKRHCNKKGETTIGVRGIAERLGINKSTACDALKELELSGFTVQRKNKLSGFSPYTVRNLRTDVSGSTVHKELGIIKEPIKSNKIIQEEKNKGLDILKNMLGR